MLPVWGVITVFLGSQLVALGLSRLRLRASGKGLKEVLEGAGLSIVEHSASVGSVRLTARSGPFEIKIKSSSKDILWLELPKRGFYNAWIKTALDGSTTEMETGDPVFDRRFVLSGSTRVLRAWLDAETRQLLLSLSARSPTLSIGNGSLQATLVLRGLADSLPLLRALSDRLPLRIDIAQRLVENAIRDPLAGVRLRNLRLLALEFPGEPVTFEAHRTACSDASPEVRLQGAKELGADGRETLLELAESTDDTTSAEAITLLGPELPAERARAILTQAMRRRLPETARVCLEALAGSATAEDVDILAKVLAREQGELAAVAATALGTTGSPAAEPPLVQALQSEQADILVAAGNALAKIGTVAAVLPLKDLAESSPLPDLRKAAREAIATIQSRLPGASPGQLSLTDLEAGQLSLAQTEAGQLSLPAEEPGQLSLAEDPGGRPSISGGEV